MRTKQRTGGQPEWHQPDAWRAGSDTLLGFTVEVVESTPSWSNSEFRTSGGITREWIEPVHMLLLKSSSEGNDGSEQRAAQVTSLHFNVEVSPDDLRFEPPRGSCDMGEGTPQRPDVVIPQGVTDVEQWLRDQKCGKPK